MRKLLIIAFLLLSLVLIITLNFAFAEIPIYCPKCKQYIYDYTKDEIIKGTQIKAEDFKPASDNIPQPQVGEEMICPLCKVPVNGWEYYAKLQHYKSFSMAYPAVSLLTKDKDGKWIWVPFDMPQLNFNEEIKN